MPTDLRSTAAFELDSPELPPPEPKGLARLTVTIPSSYSPQVKVAPHPLPRWRTPEFMVYYVVFVLVVPMMAWIPYSLSSSSHPNYPFYERRLSPGWMFGRRVDNSDNQYRSFRSGLSSLVLLASAFLGLKYLYTLVARQTRHASDNSNLFQVPFLVAFSIAMLFGLHGLSALKVLSILALNYGIAKTSAGYKATPALTWVFNGLVLFAIDRNSGFSYASLHPYLSALDAWKGVYPRWWISFNITMLRLISFNMDYHWACRRIGLPDTGSAMLDKQRPRVPHSLELYSFANYLAYVLYPPLYIAGPIMTFNDFTWQLRRPLSISPRSNLGYLARFTACILTLEAVLHFMYVVAIKDTKAWIGYSAAELCLVGFWNLIVVWLKLLVPWRFFRLWALLGGVDPPENMVRCMANNYSTLGFWRAWHRSYNLWITRYIYIPLGGTRNRGYTVVLVFTFVALWHDLSFRLLAWGWLVSLFIMPEIAARYLVPASKYGDKWWFRHVGAIGAVFNGLMMMAANLIGFVVGTDGLKYIIHQVFDTWEGIRFLIFSCVCIFVAIQVMFEYREEEERQGIARRC
ncbi:MBOAT-domain-containing protein [Trametes versicolor FP-101664 SS1]|uniref:MBOAT-domain-containing protein n=1 Tax=Trametes versicolor (strain FP-101664) TaxID=717944 RepID=UPI0004621B9D|nr:MBOAT-domain-containing protein [Trametes versicolor FP-101664 SS1]EIW57931.1 MBOAT-domain-containing protein [Trametes versicolor FP-101664 SS1]